MAGDTVDVIQAAKSKVMGPAIGLILTGVITLGLVVYNLATSGDFDAQWAAEVKKIEDDPSKKPEEKKAALEMMDSLKNVIKPFAEFAVVFQVLGIGVGVLCVVGGVRVMSLKNRGLGFASSILSMIPFISCCCLGIPFGIWMLIALSNPVVKGGFEVVRVVERVAAATTSIPASNANPEPPMPRDYDRRDDDRYDVVQDAKVKAFPPALAPMISGFLGIVCGLGLIGFAVVVGLFMDKFADTIEKQQQAMIAQQQAALAQQQQQGLPPGINPPGVVPPAVPPPMPVPVKSIFALYTAFYGVWGALLAALSAVVVIDSFKMKSLGSYGWAMTAAIVGIASVVTCNILATGFGIWALVVLMDADVKDGFTRVAGGERPRTIDRGDDV